MCSAVEQVPQEFPRVRVQRQSKSQDWKTDTETWFQ